MQKVEFLRAWSDNTWDTLQVEVPSLAEDARNGIDYDNLCDQDIENELVNYANYVLDRGSEELQVVLFAVYNSNISSLTHSRNTSG